MQEKSSPEESNGMFLSLIADGSFCALETGFAIMIDTDKPAKGRKGNHSVLADTELRLKWAS